MRDFPFAKLGDPSKPRHGQWVVAIGTIKSRIARGRAELIDRLGEGAMTADVPLFDAILQAVMSTTWCFALVRDTF